VRRAILRITADDRFTVWLNGKELGSGANWQAAARLDAAALLRPGTNLLAVRAENLKAPVALNPAGLSAALTVEFADSTKSAVPTDTAWRASKTEAANWRDPLFDDSAWPSALVTAKFGEPPWSRIGLGDPLLAPQACGSTDKLRVVYVLDARPVVVRALRPQTAYRVTHFDPVTGERSVPEEVQTTETGTAQFAPPAHGHDWILLMERL
jgi:hypothetical protein